MTTEPDTSAPADGQDSTDQPIADPDRADQAGADHDGAGDDKADLKAKFREALAHKGRHDNPEGGVDAAKRAGGDAHGKASGKRTFRRKTG